MNYEEKKKELILERYALLKEYKKFFYKTMKLASKISDIDNSNLLTSKEKLDWMMFSCNDKEMEKITRLVASLLYVESPEDKDIIFNLQENIEINNTKTK